MVPEMLIPSSPVARRRLDRVLLVLTAVAILAVAVSLTDHDGAKNNGLQIAFRIAAAGLVLARLAPWLRERYQTVRAAMKRTTATPASAPGIRRVDLYVALAVLLVAAGLFAQSRRYTVTHYRVSNTLIYQRTDTWTGRAELWTIGPTTTQPRPSWVQIATDTEPR